MLVLSWGVGSLARPLGRLVGIVFQSRTEACLTQQFHSGCILAEFNVALFVSAPNW